MMLRFLPNWQVFPSCQAAESYVKPADERANCYPILIKDAWLCSLALNFIFLSLTNKPCCSSLKRALSPWHTPQAPHLLSVFPEPFPFPHPYRQHPGKSGAWLVQNCLFFPIFFLLSRVLDLITMNFYVKNCRAVKSALNPFLKQYLW